MEGASESLQSRETSSNRINTEINATNYTGVHVFTQTLCLDVVGSHGNRRIRALIDSGSQRSYILRSTAEELDLSSKDKEIIVHYTFWWGYIRTMS